jgi:hypothetical protein
MSQNQIAKTIGERRAPTLRFRLNHRCGLSADTEAVTSLVVGFAGFQASEPLISNQMWVLGAMVLDAEIGHVEH